MGLLLILSLLFAGASWAGFFWSGVLLNRTREFETFLSVPVTQLTEDASLVARELGAGSFRQQVRLHGRIACDAPLEAELSHTKCVSYRFSVTREYEEVLWEGKGAALRRQRTRRRSEEVAANQVTTDFFLEDATGRILVRAGQAHFEMVKSHASFQPVQPSTRGYGVGRFVVDLTKAPGGTLGYRYEEHCLPLGHEVTIIAEAGDDEQGQLSLRPPETDPSRFVVTSKSSRELQSRGRAWVAALRGSSWGLAAVAVLIFLLGVVR